MRKIFSLAIIFFGVLIFAHRAQAAITMRPALNLGLVGYWSMDEGVGGLAYDKSGNGNVGTLTNMDPATDWMDGKVGKALDFDNVDDMVSVSSSVPLNNLPAITVSAWSKSNSYGEGGQGFFIDKSNSEASGWTFQKLATNSVVKFVVAYDGGIDLQVRTASNTFPASDFGNWIHWTVTWDGTPNYSGVHIYKNGVEVSYGTRTDGVGNREVDNAYSTVIGNFRTGSRTFDGVIDEARVYNRALSATEVRRLYNMKRTAVTLPSRQGLIGYWPMNEGAGTKAEDMSGNGSHGNFSGSPAWVSGKRSNALSFGGGSDHLIVSDQPVLGNMAQLTISSWVKFNQLPSVTGNTATIVSKRHSGAPWYSYHLTVSNADNKIGFQVVNSSFAPVHLPGNTALQASVWYQITATYDGSNMHIYVNGVLDDQYAVTQSGTVFDSDGNFDINYNSRLNGVMDDFRLYNRGLSATEVIRLYQTSSGIAKINTSQNSKLTDGLVGLWSFNGPDISGTTAYDRSGQNNNGTISGATPARGKVGQGLSFDGVSNEVILDGYDAFDFSQENSFTISAWAHPDGASNFAPLFSRGIVNASAGNYVYNLTANSGTPSDKWTVWLSDGVNEIYFNTNAGTLEQNVWQHMTLVWDGAIATIYKNGSSIGSGQSASFNGIWDGNEVADRRTSIGREGNSTGDEWKGLIDEVRVYNRALLAEEVMRLYNMGQ